MGIAKVTLNGVAQIDLTGVTVIAEKLHSGYSAVGADGEPVAGSYTPSAGGVTRGQTLVQAASDTLSLTFPDILGEPLMFTLFNRTQKDSSSTTKAYIAVVSKGYGVTALYTNAVVYDPSAAYIAYNRTSGGYGGASGVITANYDSNAGTLTITSDGSNSFNGLPGYFMNGQTYVLEYIY